MTGSRSIFDFYRRSQFQAWPRDRSIDPAETTKEVLTAAQIRPDGNVDHEIVTFNKTTRNDPASWSHAKAQFPELISVSPDVLKAVTLNELNIYDKMDLSPTSKIPASSKTQGCGIYCSK